MPPKPEVYALVEPFVHPDTKRSAFEAAVSIACYVALVALMFAAATSGHPLVALALSVPAAGFMIRVFIVFHDCCHGSLFRSRRANRVVGYITGFLTLTPFEQWQQSHAEHHATVGDLDRRGAGDVWTMTVEEYAAASRPYRLWYRVFRHPVVMFGINPGLLFLIGNRHAGKGSSRRARISVHLTNAYIVVLLALAYLTVGIPVLVQVMLPPLLLSSTAGVWLFYVQHQYDHVYWKRHAQWSPLDASLQGSSYYKLPAVLQWFTGSIGLHHVHHVQPRIPFYNLQPCQDAVPAFQRVPPMTLRRSLDTMWLCLFDEAGGRMVTRSEAERLIAGTR